MYPAYVPCTNKVSMTPLQPVRLVFIGVTFQEIRRKD